MRIFLILSCINTIGLATLPNGAFLTAFMKSLKLDRLSLHTSLTGVHMQAFKFQKRFNFPLAFVSLSHVRPLSTFWYADFAQHDLSFVSHESISGTFLREKLERCQYQAFTCGYFLLDVSNQKSDYVSTILSKLPLKLDHQIYLYKEVNRSYIQLQEAYKIGPQQPVTILDFGHWSSTGLTISQGDLWHRRGNLQGHTFRIATVLSPPYISKLEFNNKTRTFEAEGMFMDIFHAIQDVMNFTYVLLPSVDGEWGAIGSNGSWTGLVGMLQREEIDIAVTDFTVTQERSFVIAFPDSIIEIFHTLFVRNPQGRPNFKAYTEPFTIGAWIALVVLIICSAPVLYMVICFGNEKDHQRREFSLPKSFIFTASVMTFMRPWNVVPSSTRGKLAFGSLLIAGTLTYYHWEAMLISFLATRVIVLPFKSLQELVDETTYQITLTPGSYFMDSFKFSLDPLWKKAWEKRIEPNIDTYPRGRENVAKIIAEPNFALYHDFLAVQTYEEYINCEIVAIPELYEIKPCTYGFQKNSPYLHPFNFYLHHFKESGLLKQIVEKYESRPQVCPDYSGKALNLASCFTAFLCLLFGFLLSGLLMLIELGSNLVRCYFGIELSVLKGYEYFCNGVVEKEQATPPTQYIEIRERAKYIIANQRGVIKKLENIIAKMQLKGE